MVQRYFLLSPSKHGHQELDPQPIDINRSFSTRLNGVCARPRRDTDERRQLGYRIFLSSRALHSWTVFNVTSTPELEIFVCVNWISFNNYRGWHAIPGRVWEVQWRTWITLDMSKVMNSWVFFPSFGTWAGGREVKPVWSRASGKWRQMERYSMVVQLQAAFLCPGTQQPGQSGGRRAGAEGWCSGGS